MSRVYIAGPYSNGDKEANVFAAIDAADRIAAADHAPFIPHLTYYWDLRRPHEYKFWMEQDLEWLKVCDAVVRIDGHSPGADAEVSYAFKEAFIPVYFSVEDFLKHNGDGK